MTKQLSEARKYRNDKRADRAEAALKAFEKVSGNKMADDNEGLLGDLLTNFRHFCKREALDFDRLIARSQMHYKAEIDPDDQDENACVET